MIVLGLNAYHGDASACIFVDNKLVAAAEEERFTRIKHSAGFPSNAIKYTLKYSNLTLADIDHIAINRNPKSYLFAIVGAEYVLRWLPVGTHDWKKFVKPQEMINYVSAQRLIHQETKGVTFNPILNKWSLSNDTSVNYMACFTRN